MTAYPCHHEWTAALQLFKVITSIKLLIDFINSLISYGFSSTKAKIMTNLNSQRCFLVDMFHNVDVVEFAFEKKLIPTLFDVSKPKAFDKKITPRLCSFMTNTLALHCDFLKIYWQNENSWSELFFFVFHYLNVNGHFTLMSKDFSSLVNLWLTTLWIQWTHNFQTVIWRLFQEPWNWLQDWSLDLVHRWPFSLD